MTDTLPLRKRMTPYPAWRLVGVLMAMNIVAYLDRSILSLAAPAIQADLGLSHVQLSLLLGLAFVLSFAVLGIPFGWLVDRTPRRMVIAGGILAWSLSASAAGLARGFMALLVARFGVGAGEASLHPAAFSMITDSVPERRLGLAMTLYGGSSGLGAALSVAIGGVLLGWASGLGPISLPVIGAVAPWQLVLLLSGLPGLLMAFAIFAVPEPKRRELAVVTDATRQLPVFRFLATHWRFYLPTILGFSILQITAYSFASWQPTWMVQRFGWHIADVGLALSIGMVGAFIGSFAAGILVDRIAAAGRQDAPLLWSALASLICGAFIGTAFLVGQAWLCILLVIIGQLPIAMIGIVSMAMQQVTPNDMRGRVTAIFLLFSNLIGFGLGPFIPAFLTDHVFADQHTLGLSLAITALVASPIAAALLWSGRRPMRTMLALHPHELIR